MPEPLIASNVGSTARPAGRVALPIRAVHGICVYLLCLPFAETPLLDASLYGVAGAKPFVAISLLVLGLTLLFRRQWQSVPRTFALLIGCVIAMFVVSALRSLAITDLLSIKLDVSLSPARYMLSFLLKPLLYILPAVLIVVGVRSSNDLKMIVRTVVCAAVLTSLLALVHSYGLAQPTGFRAAREAVSSFFSLHVNALAVILVQALALAGWNAGDRAKSIKHAVVAAILLGGIGALACRTAYALVFAVPALQFLYARKIHWRYLVVAITILCVTAPSDVSRRLSTGYLSPDKLKRRLSLASGTAKRRAEQTSETNSSPANTVARAPLERPAKPSNTDAAPPKRPTAQADNTDSPANKRAAQSPSNGPADMNPNQRVFNVHEFLSQRSNRIWAPIFEALGDSPFLLLAGGGRHSMVRIPFFLEERNSELHPHNAYLEWIIDCGVVAFGLFAICLLAALRGLLRSVQQMSDEASRGLQQAVVISTLCYLAASLLSGTFFPSQVSALFWVILAIGFVNARLSSTENKDTPTMVAAA